MEQLSVAGWWKRSKPGSDNRQLATICSLHSRDALVHPPPLRPPARDLATAAARAAGVRCGVGLAVLDRAFAQAKNRGNQPRSRASTDGGTRARTTRTRLPA